jgi:hypothetical protein
MDPRRVYGRRLAGQELVALSRHLREVEEEYVGSEILSADYCGGLNVMLRM